MTLLAQFKQFLGIDRYQCRDLQHSNINWQLPAGYIGWFFARDFPDKLDVMELEGDVVCCEERDHCFVSMAQCEY